MWSQPKRSLVDHHVGVANHAEEVVSQVKSMMHPASQMARKIENNSLFVDSMLCKIFLSCNNDMTCKNMGLKWVILTFF